MLEKEELHSGSLLVAQPFMLDPYFKRSVVLLCDHHIEGTFGFILNKSVKMKINELLEDFPEFESEVFYGGPVATDTIHFLHNVGDILEGSQEVGNGVFWGGNFDRLKVLIDSQLVEPKNIRFFVGYSGWSAGQLTTEMKSGSWIVSDSKTYSIFDGKGDLWTNVLSEKNDNFSIIAHQPDSGSPN